MSDPPPPRPRSESSAGTGVRWLQVLPTLVAVLALTIVLLRLGGSEVDSVQTHSERPSEQDRGGVREARPPSGPGRAATTSSEATVVDAERGDDTATTRPRSRAAADRGSAATAAASRRALGAGPRLSAGAPPTAAHAEGPPSGPGPAAPAPTPTPTVTTTTPPTTTTGAPPPATTTTTAAPPPEPVTTTTACRNPLECCGLVDQHPACR